mgnify:CR=1 FL=1
MKKINKKFTKKYNIKEKIEKRYNILIVIISILIIILFLKLFYVQIIKKDYYKQKLKELTDIKIEGSTAPRGRIYDRNHKLIVDNKPIKVIYYEKVGNTIKQEIELAYKLSELIEIENKATEKMYKTFWMLKYPNETNNKITKEELKLLEARKITNNDILKYKYNRITEEDLNLLKEEDKKAAYIYDLMNRGYKYQEKIIKKDNVTDEEYASIASNLNKLKGINVRLDWERVYPYENTFKSILGTLSENSIPSDLEKEYLKKGYNLNDRVGISYLELEYDDYLKGEKNIYELNDKGEKILYKLGSRGNDITLTIDIELQRDIENILEEEIKKAKKERNTEYYNRSFVVVTNPKTGEILAMAGKQIVENDKNYKIYDYTPGIMTSPVTVGSVVKGASHIVGYNNGALKIGEIRRDTCVKLAGTPLKCSFMPLGVLNDITALKRSSNTYQYYTAMKVANTKYFYNTAMKPNPEALKKYRDTFKEFGLGTKTGIDLPVESIGNIGSKTDGGLILDFAIGQYDTYTPLQLSNYIGTIANNGTRMQLHLLNSVYESNSNLENKIYSYENKELNKVTTEDKYLKRVQQGFKEVLKWGGTGSGYIDLKYKPAGKTGTSQSFVDTNGDGKIDKETISATFVAYAPYDNPKVTFTIVSPDVSNYDNNSTYQTNVNKRITTRVSEAYFKKYKN